MTRHDWTFQRVCALALLVLAASPLTAPFSSGHPLDLLGGHAAHVQSKKSPDEPIVSLPSPFVMAAAPTLVVADRGTPVLGRPRGIDALDLPLRL